MNPYGKSLKLNCTIKVPEGLSIRDLNILWYRSQPSTDERCQINIVSHCGISPFSAPHRDPAVAASHFSKPLLLRNISSTAIGCYWCRSFKCDTSCTHHEPLGNLSTPFCLKAEAHYKQTFNTTLIDSRSTMADSQSTSTSMISPATTMQGIYSTTTHIAPDEWTPSPTSSFILNRDLSLPNGNDNIAGFFITKKLISLSTSSKLYLSSHSSLNPSNLPLSKGQAIIASISSVLSMSPTTVMEHNESVPIYWLFITLGVCLILAMSTCVLTSLTAHRCFKHRATKYRTTVISSQGKLLCMIGRFSVRVSVLKCQ